MAKMLLSLILWATMGYFLTGQVGAMTHIVGGSFGWRFPANTSFYQAWAKPRNFTSGDKLGKFLLRFYVCLECLFFWVDEQKYKCEFSKFLMSLSGDNPPIMTSFRSVLHLLFESHLPSLLLFTDQKKKIITIRKDKLIETLLTSQCFNDKEWKFLQNDTKSFKAIIMPKCVISLGLIESP